VGLAPWLARPGQRAGIKVEVEAEDLAQLEVSGGVSLASVAAIAATGVDYISVGALTNMCVRSTCRCVSSRWTAEFSP
jgi:hypothetical protein